MPVTAVVEVMSHEDRVQLIHQPFQQLNMRRLPPSYPWGGVFVNDYFGEELDARKRDASYRGSYEGAFAKELQAYVAEADNPAVEGLDPDDGVEVRQFIESQTRSRRKALWS